MIWQTLCKFSLCRQIPHLLLNIFMNKLYIMNIESFCSYLTPIPLIFIHSFFRKCDFCKVTQPQFAKFLCDVTRVTRSLRTTSKHTYFCIILKTIDYYSDSRYKNRQQNSIIILTTLSIRFICLFKYFDPLFTNRLQT